LAAMDNGQPSQSILDTLRTVEFRLGLKGYNVDEVDEYLEKAAVEAERLQEQLRQTVERLRQASERIAHLESAGPPTVAAAPHAEDRVADEALQQTLVMAQRFVEQAKRESQAEASRVLADAQERARSTIARAEEEANQLVNDSQLRLREEVERLEALRAQLATDVESMARHLDGERTRLRSMLADVLRWIDENVQPAESLMGMRPKAEGSRPAGAAGPARPRPRRPDGEVDSDDDAESAPPVGRVLDLRNAAAASPESRV
jgi:DivIVA domain-containing protein